MSTVETSRHQRHADSSSEAARRHGAARRDGRDHEYARENRMNPSLEALERRAGPPSTAPNEKLVWLPVAPAAAQQSRRRSSTHARAALRMRPGNPSAGTTFMATRS